MILPRSEVKALTGYVRASAQVRWLRRHGWRFIVNGLGEPVVAQAEFNRHMVGGKAAQNQQPNFEEING
ncbi:MAG TPA: DUF4224 domain-containing protein [Bradyrhizobium sp.]|jgi:hypothetical protein